VLLERGAALLDYGDPAGFPPLRETLARRMRAHGVTVSPDEILVTQGAQQALELVLKLLGRSGAAVAVESPTYGLVIPLLRLFNLRPIEIPILPDGLDLDALEAALGRERPALVYTMPNFQNPTGITTSQAHRERLLALCEAHRVPLLEDGFEEEMKYFGRAVLPIKALDRQQVVLYCGTFSKVLFPGVRIGWLVAARPCLERLTALRRVGEIAPSAVLQAALAEFGERGYFDLHLSRMHRVFRKRMSLALRTLRESLPKTWAEWQEPHGGYLIWLRLLRPPGQAPPDWPRLLAARGVEVRLGAGFFVAPPDLMHVRLSISTLDEDEIVTGIRRLVAAVADAHGAPRTATDE
jgi:DNA-binding transcriptional MocR family regulator